MSSLKELKHLRRLKQIGKIKRNPPDPIKRWSIKTGDKVELLAGKDKGKQGIVRLLDHESNKLYVTGLNTILVKHRMRGDDFKGQVEREAPLHYSNVALIDPKDGKPCRVTYQYSEDGKKVRISTRSKRIIPFPVPKEDYLDKAQGDGMADTLPKEVTKKTFVPSLMTFEEEIAEKFGLVISKPSDSGSSPSTVQETSV